jgi:type I restriction enzyme M protein
MILGSIPSLIDQIWNAFWSGGVSNPLSVIEQLTFFILFENANLKISAPR